MKKLFLITMLFAGSQAFGMAKYAAEVEAKVNKFCPWVSGEDLYSQEKAIVSMALPADIALFGGELFSNDSIQSVVEGIKLNNDRLNRLRGLSCYLADNQRNEVVEYVLHALYKNFGQHADGNTRNNLAEDDLDVKVNVLAPLLLGDAGVAKRGVDALEKERAELVANLEVLIHTYDNMQRPGSKIVEFTGQSDDDIRDTKDHHRHVFMRDGDVIDRAEAERIYALQKEELESLSDLVGDFGDEGDDEGGM